MVEKFTRGYIFGRVNPTRLVSDRRHGVDRRAVPRRGAVVAVRVERRRVVDRRRGAERRSTLERRGRPTRRAAVESPGEHVRNALQLLGELHFMREPSLAAAVRRLERALELLGRR
jgi:hypothetical protein